jgi:hypothetical protein
LTEYAASIEVWFEAEDDGDAKEITVWLAARALDHPHVFQVDADLPESQE